VWDVDLEVELLRDSGRKNFWFFFLDVFGAGKNPKGESWIDPDIHKPIADWFQHHVDEWFAARAEGKGAQKHIALLVPREFGKSTMITQAGLLWLHLRDPETSSYIGAESTALAKKMLDGIKGALDGSDPYCLFTTLYGSWSSNARSWTGVQITHSARRNTSRRDPSFGTFSVETSITGSHPDVIVYDDPISYERLTTDTQWLASVNSQVTSLIPVIQKDGLTIWVGTRYDDDDHFGVAFREEGVRSLSGMKTDSITLDPEGKWDVYFLSARDEEGKPVSEKIWPEPRLKAFERRDPLRYAAQVLNDPSVSEFNPITRAQLKDCVCKSTDVPWGSLRYAFLCDTAFWDGKSRARKDHSVILSIGYPRNMSGDIYVVEVHGSNTWRAEDFGKKLVTMTQKYRSQGRKVFAITDEVTMAGKKGAWEQSLKNFFADAGEPMPPFMEFSRGGTKKIQRIISAISFVVDGHVRFVEGAPGIEILMDQMAKVGQMMMAKRSQDDYVDAFADAFQKELYQPMRRSSTTKAPWEPGAKLLDVEGIDFDEFRDDEWDLSNPRPPIR
jgi:hypothetical protein